MILSARHRKGGGGTCPARVVLGRETTAPARREPAQPFPVGRGKPAVTLPLGCFLYGDAVRDYLGAVLPGLSGVSIQRIAEFTPAAWAARNL